MAMTTRAKVGCGVGILTIFVALPISLAGTYFLYKHVDAPEIVWVLWIINIPIHILISIGSKLIESGLAGKETE